MKKKITLFLTLICFSMLGFSQANIAQARSNFSTGQSVTVTGICLNGIEMGSVVRYIQDESAGIAIFPGGAGWGSFPVPNVGDQVTVTGDLSEFNGLLEVGPTLDAVTIVSTGNALPVPQLITPNQINESVEGELVQIDFVQFDNAGATLSGNSTSAFENDNNEPGVIYVRNGSALVGTNLPAGVVTLVGIVSQFDNSPPFTDGYQILPRSASDFVLPAGINIIGQVIQTNIATTSFDLNWVTDTPGDSEVQYGLTEALGEVVTVPGSSLFHTVTLPGLIPGSIYYARARSTNVDSDNAESTISPYATKSESTGSIRVYFNNAVDNTVATIELAQNIDNNTNDSIAHYISLAQESVDIAIYNMGDEDVITDAINQAYTDGVNVRIIVEGENANMGIPNLNSAIPVVQRMNSEGSGMHNKFIVIDPLSVNNSWVWTGSMNWTSQNLYSDFNNIIIFQDQSLAKAYTLEFNEMWGTTNNTPDLVNSKFGGDKQNNTPKNFIIGESPVELYFSPSDNANQAIINTAQTCDASLYFAVLAFTRDDIAAAIIAEENLFLTEVEGIMEQISDAASEFEILNNGGIPTYSHEGITYDLHHKYMIVDQNTDSDPLVLTGSHNWSSAANTVNDENTVIVHNDRIANLFYQEWKARKTQITSDIEKTSLVNFNMYPNPTSSDFLIGISPNMVNAELMIFDLNGKLVHNQILRSNINAIRHDLSDGVYQIHIESEGAQMNKKLVVQH